LRKAPVEGWKRSPAEDKAKYWTSYSVYRNFRNNGAGPCRHWPITGPRGHTQAYMHILWLIWCHAHLIQVS